MRRLRVQVTVLVALLGLLLVAWGSAIFLAARDAARSSASLQSTVDRVDELRQAATRLSRDFVTMQTSRRAFLLTGDQAAERAQVRAEISAVQQFRQLRRLSVRWRSLAPAVEGVADEYRAWVRTGHTELAARRRRGAGAAALAAASGNADRHFRRLWDGPDPGRAHRPDAVGRPGPAGHLAAPGRGGAGRRPALGLGPPGRRGPRDPGGARGRERAGAVASDLETMRRRLAGRMEALERLRHLSAQVVGATSLQRLAEVVLEGLRPEIGATRAVLGAARPGGDLALRALAGFPDPAGADDIAKADAELHLVLPLHTLRAGQVVAWPTSTR